MFYGSFSDTLGYLLEFAGKNGLGTSELEEGFPRHLGGASLFVRQLFNDNLASKEFFDQKEIYFCGYALNANEKKSGLKK